MTTKLKYCGHCETGFSREMNVSFCPWCKGEFLSGKELESFLEEQERKTFQKADQLRNEDFETTREGDGIPQNGLEVLELCDVADEWRYELLRARGELTDA